MKKSIRELRQFLILWSTQSLSQLGSSMTGFALTLWLYEATGSALKMALASVCSYAPYVLMSVFAGALSDRWDKRRTMLAADAFAALCTLTVLALFRAGALRPWHLYLLNGLNGLMNTVQSPAGDVAMTLVTPRAHYQRASGLRSLSHSLNTILHPVLATAVFSAAGLAGVIYVDLSTFLAAFASLILFVRIPSPAPSISAAREGLLDSARSGLEYLREQGLILRLILFLAGVNLIASAFDAALPAYVLSMERGGRAALGAVTGCAGFATLAGSLLAAVLPPPRDRVRVIVWTLLFSLTSENLILAFARSPAWWCLAQLAGWAVVPVMNANLDVILRSTVPAGLQGRVFACRNTMQFFTIPVGTFLGGCLADNLRLPLAEAGIMSPLSDGGGTALVMLILGVAGALMCLVFGWVLRGFSFPGGD